MNDKLGIHNINPNIGSGGIGWVVVPEGINRQEYIDDCYRTNTLTINGGYGYSCFSDVYVAQDVMQNIIFPNDESNRGSSVVWIRDETSNLPIIIATIRKQENYYVLNENQYRLARENGDNSVEVFIDGNTSTLHINVIGDEKTASTINVKLSSKNADSSFNLSSDNEINIFCEKEINTIVNNSISIKLQEAGEDKAELKYKRGEGLTYFDEFGNNIVAKDGEINIISNKINHNKGNEPMVLGETLSEILKELLSAVKQLTVMTPVGKSSIPINVDRFIKIENKIDEIKSKKSNLE